MGEEGIVSHSRGGNRTSFLSWQKKEELLSEIGKRAEKGLLVVVKTIKAEIEARIGRTVSKDYPYDLLYRHGWRKVVPRPKHPKQDTETQEDFKKTSGIPGSRLAKFSTQ
jgi:transposase